MSVAPSEFPPPVDSAEEFVGPPVLVLGAVSPWAIRLRVRAVEDAGDVTGRLYALSTAGGLVGTFASALLLIPLAIVLQVLFGSVTPFFQSVVTNLVAIIKAFADGGLIGLIAIAVVIWLFSRALGGERA